jgi:TonB family protein
MLVSIYLEQPNYDRAKNLLTETFERNKNRRSGFETVYLPVAGQIIKNSYDQLERYKKLGFSLADPSLPAEAATDLDKWRKLLETVVEQSKQVSLDDKKTAESLAVLEQAAGARSALARDEYEAAQWRNTIDDTREMIANAQSKVTDVDPTLLEVQNVASNVFASAVIERASTKEPVKLLGGASSSSTKSFLSETDAPTAKKLIVNNSNLTAKNNEQPSNNAVDKQLTNIKVATEHSKKINLLQVGSLVEMATRKSPPSYPSTARSARISGVVKVEVVVDETGSVKEVKVMEGPELLRRAAIDAIRRWKFKPMVKDGQPTAMSGFVNFNFTL